MLSIKEKVSTKLFSSKFSLKEFRYTDNSNLVCFKVDLNYFNCLLVQGPINLMYLILKLSYIEISFLNSFHHYLHGYVASLVRDVLVSVQAQGFGQLDPTRKE